MTNGSNGDGYLGLIKTAFGWVTAVAGFLTASVTCAKVISGNTGLVLYLVTAIGFVSLWGSCFYLRFQKKKRPPQWPSTKPTYESAFPARVRQVAWWGMILVPAIALVLVGVQIKRSRQRPNKVIVAVANFPNVGPTGSGVTERLISKLQQAVNPYSSEIEIVSLNRAVSVQEGSSVARQLGNERKATIVIWGWYDQFAIQAYFEVLLNTPHYRSATDTDQPLPLDFILEDEKTLKVQQNLSENLAYLTLLGVGLARYESQDSDGAISLFREALSHVTPQSSEAESSRHARIALGYYYLACALVERGNYNEAKTNFVETIKYSPNHEAAHLQLGYVYRLLGEDDFAVQEFNQVITLCTAQIEQAKATVDVYNSRASAYGELDRFDEALRDYDRVIQLDPKSARAFNNRGLIFYKKGDTKLALENFNLALAQAPTDAGVYNNRGLAYSKLQEFPQALDDYSMVIKYRPNNSLSYLSRAFVFFDKHDYASAITDYDQAIRLEPSNIRAYRNRAWAHYFVGNYDKATTDADHFLRSYGQCNNNKNYMYLVILEYLSLRKNSLDTQAGSLLDRAVADCGPAKWQYTLLRFLHHDVNEQRLLAEAGNDLERVTEARAYVGMGLLFGGRNEQAISHFQWISESGDREIDEYHLALAELKRMNVSPQVSVPK